MRVARALPILVLLLTAGLSACSSAPPRARVAAELRQANVAGVQPLTEFGDVLLGGQPSAEAFATLRERGVAVVLDMRTPGELKEFDERARVEALGMRYVCVPWAGPEQLTDAVFDEHRRILNTEPGPLLVHCASANRVGAIWIAWRALDGGVELEQAVFEAKRIGLRSKGLEDLARDYVRRRR